MARITKGILKDLEGHLGDFTIQKRFGETIIRPRHIHQPRRVTPDKLRTQARQSHNNILWRALKLTGKVFFEGPKAKYNRFMSINMESPVPFLTKRQYKAGNALLLPKMVLSDGPLKPVGYQLGDVDGIPALLTDLTKQEARKDTLLLYVLQQQVINHQGLPEEFYLRIKVETLTLDSFTAVPSTLLSPYKDAKGTLALIGERFADPMHGFGIVRVADGHASTQHAVTQCTYFEQYTTDEALSAAAKSYGGFTSPK